jgi:hypothetical protein
MVKPMIAYEDISNVDGTKTVVSATEILEKGWARRKYPLISLNDPIPWSLRTQQERSWNFYIHCWDMLDSLLKAYSETQEKQFIRPAIRVAEDWAEKHSDLSQADMSPLAWYDMAVGLRAYRLAYIIDAGKDAGLLDQDLRNKLWASLEQHQAYLADDKNILFHNNHGYYQVAGQLAMGRRFAGESPLMAQTLEQGKDRLKAMLAQQFAEDGIHLEHSPDYHRMVLDTLKAMIDSGLVEDADTIAFAETTERALSWFVLPSQHIVNFGDSDYRRMRRSPTEAEQKWRTAEMRYVVSGGKVGQLPAEHLAVFPESGYVAVRTPAKDAPQDFSKSSYLAQMAAFHSRTHKHADDLSFIWSDRGSDILVDAGRYGYLGKTEQGSELWLDGHWYSDPNRVYCESTRAHNTLEFDGKNYPRKGPKPYGSALRRWVQDASGIVAVETECKHFHSVRRVRMLLFLPGKWLVALDWFHDNAQQPHGAKQWFHLAPHLQLLLQGGGYLVSMPSSIEPLRIIGLLDGPFASRPYLGEKKPVMQGWWSAKERDIVPNYAFCYELSGVSTGVFATLFSFSNSLATDTTWNKVNVSGRKAQFRWKDETGAHELRLERPESGDLSVSYSVR